MVIKTIREMIQEALFTSPILIKPQSPFDIDIKVIKAILASELNNMFHSRLPKIHWSNIVRNRYSVCYGLHYGENWVGVGIWSSPVNQNFDIVKTLELRRLALSDMCPKNTASNIISRMINEITVRFPLVTDLISYQDTEVHKGTIYKASNWVVDGETKFTTWGKSRKRSSDQSKANKIRWKYIIKRK